MTHDMQTSQYKHLLVPAVWSVFVYMSGVLGLYGEYTVNIQWKYNEHTMNIQWTYSEHTVNIQWTYTLSFYTDFVNFPTTCRLKFTLNVTTHDMQISQYKHLLVPAVWPVFVYMSGVLGLYSKHTVNIQWTYSEHTVNIYAFFLHWQICSAGVPVNSVRGIT